MRVYSLTCLSCLKVWMSTSRDPQCPYCDSKAVADTGKAQA